MLRYLVLAGVCLCSPFSLDGSERLAIRVSPSVAFAPANLVVRATVETNPDNRAIEIVADSPGFYRSSQIQLDGEKAPRTTTFEFRDMPSGTYEVSAALTDVRGRRVTVHHQIHVVGGPIGR